MVNSITALQLMEQTNSKGHRNPFQLSFVTADRDAWRKLKNIRANMANLNPESEEYKELESVANAIDIGGKVISHPTCILSGTRGMHAKAEKKPTMIKNPNHFRNKTRNIIFKPSEQIRKVHIRLMVEFNNQPILY